MEDKLKLLKLDLLDRIRLLKKDNQDPRESFIIGSDELVEEFEKEYERKSGFNDALEEVIKVINETWRI